LWLACESEPYYLTYPDSSGKFLQAAVFNQTGRPNIMKTSNHIHELIHCLSKGERRNFKLFSRLQEGDKMYDRLFDAIEKQRKYDEPQLLKKFREDKFVKQFSVAKNYLYNFILRTLHIFEKNPESDLKTLLNQVQILIEKNLFDHAEKLARKARHIAERQECFTELLEVLGYQRQIYRNFNMRGELSSYVDDIQEAENEAFEKCGNLLQYQQIHDKIFRCLRESELARRPSELIIFDRILSDPLVRNPGESKSWNANLLRISILRDCHHYAGAFDKCLTLTQEIISCYESNLDMLENFRLKYIMEIGNLAAFYYLCKENSHAADTLDKLRGLDISTIQERAKVLGRYYGMWMGIVIGSGDIAKGMQILEQMTFDIREMRGKLNRGLEFHLYYYAAYFWQMAGEPSRALPWINLLLNRPRSEVRIDLQCFARLLNLVIHYDLGNKDLVEHECKSAYRFIHKRNRLYEVERRVLRFMQRAASVSGEAEEKIAFQELRDDLLNLTKNPFELKALNCFEFLDWTESHLKGKTMASLRDPSGEKVPG